MKTFDTVKRGQDILISPSEAGITSCMRGVTVETLLKSRDGTKYLVSEANSNACNLMLSENRARPNGH